MNFTLSLADVINGFVICVGVGICGLNLLQVSFAAGLKKQVSRYFGFFFGFIIVYILSHLLRSLFDGVAGGGTRVFLQMVTFNEFLSSGFMVYMISVLVAYLARPKRIKGFFIFFLCVLAVYAVTLFISQFFDLYYFFDENNVFNRSPLYILSNGAHIVMLVTNMYLLIRYRAAVQKRIKRAIWVCLLAPLAAIALQAFIKDVQFIIIATVFGAVYMYVSIMWNVIEDNEKQKMDNQRIETELSMASAIQADMMPNIFPAFPERPDFEIYASMQPAKEVGGDFYDFFLIDDDTLALVIADVSGKGIPAALFMMVSKILVQNYAMMGNSPEKTLEAVNKQICSNNRENMFVTVWLGIIDLKTGELKASNAGHEYPEIKRADGDFSTLKDKHGFVIGGMAEARYSGYSVKMEKGSKIFVYTDGVAEAKNGDGELFGGERLSAALKKYGNGSPEEIIAGVEKEIKEFAGDAPQFDDVTMLCLQYNGGDMKAKEMTVVATVENIGRVTEFVNSELEKYDCPPKAQMQIDVAIDELFGNIARYAYDPEVGPATVRVEVEEEPLAVVITFIDNGKPFDPLASKTPDIGLSAEDREIGGLGVFLVRKTMDEITYEYSGGQNILKIKKNM